jgi:hypothetical protein
MCKEISPDLKTKVSGPVTGQPKKPKRGDQLDESALPWNKIRTRFDLLREELRLSLLRLPADKWFSVVWFGDESGNFDACKSMVRATKTNVDRVLAEIDAMVPGKPDPVKAPDGVLKGKTNMHSGMRRAMSLSNKGYVEDVAYVDPAVLTEGCDTIFLFTDGEPSWDDFYQKDRDFGEGKPIVDSEYGAAAARTPEMIYWGPYNQPDWLIADLERMNAFRRVRIHCIGIGEASGGLLKRIADVGHGVAFDVGKDGESRKTAGAK